MNIKITHNWLLDYLDTDASPVEIQKFVSLCGPSIESVEPTGTGDYVYDVEITSNRIDSASVYGLALECRAILPMFGKKACLKNDPLREYSLTGTVNSDPETLHVRFESNDLCSRFAVAVFENISAGASPSFIRDRLKAIGIKSINNVVDISNYLMVTLGQPTHIFDYDKIRGHTMIMRKSVKKEKITTLDGKTIELPGDDIVIEDGSGELIDLCGIMGGANSAFTEKTKRIVLFVQTYNKSRIRRTTMLTNQRTIAATYFEKGLDEERITPTLAYGMALLKQYTGAKPVGKVIDIKTKDYKPRIISFTSHKITEKIGISVPDEKIEQILLSLGFAVNKKNNEFEVSVPSFRQYDVEIVEDLVEEIARIFGYHNLPDNLSPAVHVVQPPEFEKLFINQNKIKLFLKHLGMHEVLNYSMISLEMITALGLQADSHLCLSNVMSEDIKYLRTTLLPSLIRNIKMNEGKKSPLRLFELAKVYLPRTGELPDELYRLALITNTSLSDLKGILEGLFYELHIGSFDYVASKTPYLHPSIRADIVLNGNNVGKMGKLDAVHKNNFELDSDCFMAELDFSSLISSSKNLLPYRPIHPYAVIKLDLTVRLKPGITFSFIKKTSFKISSHLTEIKVIDRYHDSVTIRMYFSSPERNLTEDEAKRELQTISQALAERV